MSDAALKIEHPLIELLAIKLYEHDFQGKWPPPGTQPSWIYLPDEDRESYRKMARGEEEYDPKEMIEQGERDRR